MWAYVDAVTHYLPDGCENAYKALLNNPDITDQELADLIEPPIKIISHANKHIGMSDNPRDEYEKYMHKVGADELPDDVDPLFSEDTGLYLRISPFTRPTEIKAFIDKYYDKEMWPHLKKQPIWETKQSKYMNDRNSKLRKTVGYGEEAKQLIIALHAEGKKSPEIENILQEKFGESPTQSNIRQIISKAKQK